MDKLRFICFASGSSGNCFFIGNAHEGILIDAGIGIRTIKRELKAIGLEFSNLLGVFITHDHFDHVKAIQPLKEKYFVPVFATSIIHEVLQLEPVPERQILEKNVPIHIKEWTITAFAISHDGTDNVGYTLEYDGKRFTLLTDLGYICENAAHHISQADYLVIEANYDEEMLDHGSYPTMLKNRIRSNKGHLSNSDAGRFLADNMQPNLKYIYLCHLSHSNNIPDLAYCTVSDLLAEQGIVVGRDVELVTLDRTSPSKLYIFD
jgi:phosphoribosyl 1,2-cyclic phosphodiesterase